MLRDTLLGLTHDEGVSKWEVTVYKDAQLLCLNLMVLIGVYCVNSIELFGMSWRRSVGFLFTSPQSVSLIVARDRLEGIVIL
ncbi:hypothetical protein DSO57_1000202 [Entomophthora muscae]|uniref:Uncharacterized protein n=1 Tax=Entomophthora muscae TaxID=34485 RepID=A0ACC2U793_9FUNG|nr:hypothetical protein DSO57_1000202 [Entomophthora muscae]